MIYIASDHGGFNLKNTLISYLKNKGLDIKDMGPFELVEEDDYTEYVTPLAKEIQKDLRGKGIVICRNGVGVNIAANKFKHIRAALSWETEHIKSARLDDDINVLALPADYIDENTAKSIVDAYLNTEFSALPRHIRRIKKVENL